MSVVLAGLKIQDLQQPLGYLVANRTNRAFRSGVGHLIKASDVPPLIVTGQRKSTVAAAAGALTCELLSNPIETIREALSPQQSWSSVKNAICVSGWGRLHG